MTCICMHVCALYSPPVRCMVARASCAVGDMVTVTKQFLVLHHILQAYALQEKNKAVGINLHFSHPRLYATTVSTLGPGFRIYSRTFPRCASSKYVREYRGHEYLYKHLVLPYSRGAPSRREHIVPFANRRVRESAFS